MNNEMPLEKISVLELRSEGPVQFCGMILADMGANVVSIGRILKEKDALSAGKSSYGWDFNELAKNLGDALSRNKRSILLNLKSEDGRKIFYRMTESADVVIEGFRPGVVESLELSYEKIAEINPKIIYCSISGYGQNGPYRTMPGHDPNYVGMGGAFSVIGIKDGPPVIPMNLVADWPAGSLNGVIGILAALVAREQTGRGQFVDIAITDGVVANMNLAVYDYFNSNRDWKRGATPLNGGFPCVALFRAGDCEYISIGCIEPWFWERLCRELGVEEFIPHQWAEGKKRDEIFKRFSEIFLTKSRDEWFNILINKNICVGKVYNIGELANDPQVKHREMLVEIEHPIKGKVTQAGQPIKLSDSPTNLNRYPIALPGQHTEEILQENGFTEEDLKIFYASGAISKYTGV